MNKTYEVRVTHGDGFPRTLCEEMSLEGALNEMMCMDDEDWADDDEEYDDALFSVHETGNPEYVAWVNTDGECGTDLDAEDPRRKTVDKFLM